MSNATFTFGRFNVPTEGGHGKLISAVQSHAEETGGTHYVFPTHSQDPKKNPLTHGEKVGFMRRMFPTANIVSNPGIRTAIDAVKHLESKGHTHVTMVVGSDRVDEFHKLLNKYRKKEFPGVKKIKVVSAGHRDPDAEGAEGVSASKLRGLIAAGKEQEFISQYSDPKLGKQIHDKAKAGMQMESINPIGIFLLGAPGSGKDYVLNNIFSRFDLTEVQADQIVNQSANELYESKTNLVINGALDEARIAKIQDMLHEHGYTYDFVYVSVTNKVSRLRNEQRENPIAENKRIDKFLKAEKLAAFVEAHVFNNSINLNESSEMEKVFFASEIQKLLERITALGLEIKSKAEPKSFAVIKEKYFPPVAKDKESGLPKKYVAGLSPSTAKARAAHWNKADKLSDSDPKAYEPAPGDATAKTKPSKHTLAVRKMMGEEVVVEGKADKSLAAKAEKSGISIGTLRKVYRRGVAAWNSGHRPGTTPSQWGHARVNSYINRGKTYHTADKDLREETDINDLFEMQLVGTDEYRKHAVSMTPGQNQEIEDAFPVKSPTKTPVAVPAKPGKSIVSQYTAEEESDCCGGSSLSVKEQTNLRTNPRNFRELRGAIKEASKEVELPPTADVTPTLKKGKGSNRITTPSRLVNPSIDGLPVTSRLTGEEVELAEGEVVPFKSKQTEIPTNRFERKQNQVQIQRQVAADASNARSLDQIPKDTAAALDTRSGAQKAADAVKTGAARAGLGKVAGAAIPVANALTLANIAKDVAGAVGRDTPEKAAERQKRLDDMETRRQQLTKGINFAGDKGVPASVTHSMASTALNKTAAGKKVKDFLKPAGDIRDLPDPLSFATTAAMAPFSKDISVSQGWDKLRGDTSYWWNKAKEKLSGQKTNEEVNLIEEAVMYHLSENISLTQNAFRPGSKMFFEMINIAKELYKEGHYTPTDEYEKDLLDSDVGEYAAYEGSMVPLDFPFEDSLTEEDATNGKGIGKPWREGGGGAVYVRDGDSIRKIRFSQSGMKKKFMDPGATRSFVARHHCLTNKDKTSASYWACRWPRFFSNSGKTWW